MRLPCGAFMTLDLRPLTLGELFDRAFMLYRRHFWLFVGIAAVPGVFALLMSLAQQGIQSAMVPIANPAAPDPEAAAENLGMVLWLFAGMMGALVVYGVVYMIALGATTFAVSELNEGRPVTIAHVYGQMRGRIGALIVLLLLIGLRLFGLMLLGTLLIGVAAAAAAVAAGSAAGSIIGGLLAVVIALMLFAVAAFMMLRYGVAVPALVIEGLPPAASIGRSVELTKGRLGRVFLLMLCASLVTYAAVVLFQGPFFAGALLSGLDTTQGFWLNVAGSVTGTIGATLTSPFMVIGLALIYYDARIREEGLDVELALAALDGASATARE
jgi:hypothetical protein